MNDLNAPLGFKGGSAKKIRIPFGAIMATLVVSLVAALAVWLVVVNDPLGGEPVAVVKIETTASTVDRGEIATVGVKSSSGELLPPVSDKPGDETASAAGEVATAEAPPPPANGPLVVEADPDLLESSAYGSLPRISPDGRKPIDVYARPMANFVGASPRIALVVTDLGLSQSGTQEALRVLPGPVTLAFAPYGASLDRWTAKARESGHELLVQVPLEPFDYPDNDPGENTLLTGAELERNLDNLHAVMGKFTTYVGVINYMGGKFTADAGALDSLMIEVGKRGLMYVDDGSSARSIAGKAAEKRETPFARADLVLDAVPTPAEISSRLVQLEQTARSRGIAVGVTSARPAAVRAIADWSKDIEARGITLVPITGAREKN
jgi:polysaccharide deacetylase 2 family uncharacterized protein YibQ